MHICGALDACNGSWRPVSAFAYSATAADPTATVQLQALGGMQFNGRAGSGYRVGADDVAKPDNGGSKPALRKQNMLAFYSIQNAPGALADEVEEKPRSSSASRYSDRRHDTP